MTEKITVHLDTTALTLGDLELFEEATGGNLMEVLEPKIVRDPETGKPVPDPDDPKRPLRRMEVDAKTMVALVYIARHKEDPSVTLAQTKAIPLAALDLQMEMEVPDEDPTLPADEPSDDSTG